MAISVLIAQDHKIFREGLLLILKRYPTTEVVGEATDGLEAVRVAKKLWPDVVLMDIRMPKLDGVEATRRIVTWRKSTQVVALTVLGDIEHTRRMLTAGASGYVTKECASEEVVDAIEVVMSGGVYLSPSLTDAALQDYAHGLSGNVQKKVHLLTQREREILTLLASGLSRKEIAAHLYISVKSVDSHRKNMMEKLDIHDSPSLLRFALQDRYDVR